MVLQCYLTLADALPLAEQAICIILPCGRTTLSRVEDDPRLPLFFQHSLANTPIWVVQDADVLSQSTLKELLSPTLELVSYATGIDLAETGQRIANRLQQR